MATLILPLRLLGAVLLVGALSACSTSRTLSSDAPPPSGAPPGGSAAYGPYPSAAGSTSGGSAGLSGTLGAPPSSGTGGR